MNLYHKMQKDWEPGDRKNYLTYESLKAISQDTTPFGITSFIHQNRLCHHLLQDILINVQQYTRSKRIKISIYTEEVPASFTLLTDAVDPHYNDHVELSFVLKGTLVSNIDGKEYTFHENEMYMVNTGITYYELIDLSDAVVFNISLRSNIFDEMLLSDIQENSLQAFIRNCLIQEKNSQSLLRFSPRNKENQILLSDLVSSIFMEYRRKDSGYLYVVKGYIFRLLDFLANSYDYSFSEYKKKKYSELLFHEVKKFMLQHIKTVQMQDLCEKFHYRSNYFNKLIHEYTGMSYSNYLIFLRIQLAKELLLESDNNIDDIMYSVGYHNKGFFYKNFKQSEGMTPALYRKTTKKGS